MSTVRNNVTARAIILAGTALGCTLTIVPVAAAQTRNITYTGAGPYTLTQTTPVAGGPRAVDITLTSGDAIVDTSATTVTTTNNGTADGTGVAVNNTGAGATTVRNGDITASGSGRINTIDARATTGTITIVNSGTINASGNNGDRAIVARSGGGDVSITSNVANGQQYGIIVTGNGGTFGDTGLTTINSTTATANGTGLVNAIVAQGSRVVLTSGTATNTNAAGNQGTAIFVNAGTGGALVNAGITTAFGQNQAAIQVFSDGAVDVISGAIRTTQNSDGLSIASGTNIVARSTAITIENGGRGIVLGGNAGGGGFNSGVDGFAYTSAAVTSGTITTAGANAYGIYATPTGTGTTTLTSDTIRTIGAGATGVFVTAIGNGAIGGATTINSTAQINTTGANATGVLVNGGSGAVTVNNTGLVSATGAGSIGISLQGGTGGRTIASDRINTGSGNGIDVATDGIVDIRSTTITRGAAGFGINVAGGDSGPASATIVSGTITGGNFGINTGGTRGDTSITSGTIALTSAASGTGTSLNGFGIFANGTGAVAINSGSIAFTGSGNTAGIQGQAGGNVTITSRDVSVIGNGGYGILGASQTGAVTITSTGTIATTGTTRQAGGQAGVANARYADGILAYNPVGAISITNAGTINTSGAMARGISVEAGRAIQSFGAPAATASTAAISINSSGTIRTTGNDASGISIRADSNPVTVASNAITTTGSSAYGINILPAAGTTTLTGTGTITTSGTGAHGIFLNPAAGTNTGAVSITQNAITASGINAQGIWVLNAGGPVTINANDVRTPGGGAAIVVQQTAGSTAPIAVQAGTIRSGSASAAINLSSNGTTGAITAGVVDSISIGSAIDARSVGAVTLTTGSVQTTGANATGLVAISSGGTASVTSSNLSTVNRGIYAKGLDSATVVSGTLVTTNSDRAIVATTSAASNGDTVIGTGAGVVSVTSTSLSTNGIGINAYGPRATINVNSGTLTTTGAVNAIDAFGVDVNVTSGTLTSGGTGINVGFETGSTQRGAMVVNSGTVNLNGTAGTTFGGIIAGGGLNVNVNSGTITATGVGNRFGISAQTAVNSTVGQPNAGALTVNSGSITTVGNGAYGIFGLSDGGPVKIASTGQITTTGTTRIAGNQPRYSAGIIAVSSSGSIDVTSNNISTTGAQADGIRVEAGNAIASYNPAPNVAPAPIAVTTTGLTQTAGAQASGIDILGGGGAVTVANTGTITTTGDAGYGINVAAGAGATTITSNVVGTGGVGATGIRINGTGAAAVTATNTTTTGLAANALDVRTTGAATIASTTARAAQGTGVFVQAGGLATMGATTAAGGGNGASGISAIGGTGVALTVGIASSTGTAVTDANGVVTRADAIFAQATNGAINASIGSASATGTGADAVRLIANGTGGAVAVDISGALSSTSGYGLFIDPPGAVVVNVAAGASVAGGLGGINTTGGSNMITNLGTISSSGGAAIIAAGPTTIDNSGTITGANGIAVQLGGANDSVTLRTGSAITGRIVGGGGIDAAILVGTTTTPTGAQTIAGFDSFDRLTVQSGYWTAAPTNPSAFNSATIASGASLEVANGATGIAGITTPSIVDNGTLVVRSSAASAGNTFGTTTVTGTGGVLFTGAGTTTLAGTNSLQNTGNNTIDSGTVLVTGTQGGTFVTTTNGTLQLGTGSTGGTFTGNLANNGTLVVNRTDDSSFTGALTGTGLFVKQGTGRVTFGSGYAFTGTTQLNGGTIRLSTPVAANTELDLRGTGTVDLSGQNNTIAELAGNSAAASVNIAGGSLTVNQATSTTFAGSIVGAGTLTKTGTGTLNLTGTSTYAGPTAVNGGRLAVNGSIVSPVFVNSGGTLGGTGSVGSTTVASGGTWAPGNSIGTQTLNGNVTFAAGSIYQVEANAAGAADRINATATATLSGGTVQVLAENGGYARRTDYTILTAAGGVNGRFSGVTSNLAFLSPSLGYGVNAVTLSLTRNDVSFASVAATDNQRGVANAIFAREVNDPLFTNILFRSEESARTAFTALSGELNAGLNTELADNGRRVRQAVLDRGAIDSTIGGDGFGLWVQGLQSTGLSDATTDRARLHANRTGVIGGVDYTAGALRIGGFGGYQDDHVTLRGRASSAKVDTAFAGANVAWHAGPLLIQAGGLYAWHDVDTTRSLADAGLGTATASPDANGAQLFAEAGYALTDGPVLVTPFVRNAYTWSRVKAFTEAGGTGALTIARDRRDIGLASAGIRVDGSAPLGSLTFAPRLSIAYQRGYGDLEGIAVQRFGGTGPAFVATGASLGKDGVAVDGGFDVQAGRFSIGVGGFASTSDRWGDYGGKLALGVRF